MQTRRTLCLLLGLMAALRAAGDELELLNGQRIQGTVVEETAKGVTIRVAVGESSAQMKFAAARIHAVTTGGTRRVLNEKSAAPAAKAAPAPASAESASPATAAAESPTPSVETPAPASRRTPRTRAEVQALIRQAGSTPPEWWDSEPLDYPQTLDLSWPEKPQGPWNPQKNVGQYIWSTINENPGKWRSGVKFLHHLLTVHKDDPKTLARVMESLASAYFNLQQDYARAAFWWEKSAQRNAPGVFNAVRLGECYWRLGNKAMAVEQLNLVKGYLSSGIAKLWSDIGELDKALALAQAMVRQGARSDDWLVADGYLVAGDACRFHGRYKEAMAHYAKALAVPAVGQRKGGVERAHKRAQDNLDAVKVYDALDLKRIPNGTYNATSTAYAGPLQVAVTVADGRIEEVKVAQHSDKQYYGSIVEIPKQIVAKQGVKGIDAVTCATITSEAIVNATAKALAGAVK